MSATHQNAVKIINGTLSLLSIVYKLPFLGFTPVDELSGKDLKLPADSILATVIRENQIMFPKGETTLLPGDSVIALTTIEQEKALRETLIGKE